MNLIRVGYSVRLKWVKHNAPSRYDLSGRLMASRYDLSGRLMASSYDLSGRLMASSYDLSGRLMAYNKANELIGDNSILQGSTFCLHVVFRFCQIKLICINISICDASSFPGILFFQTRTQDFVGNTLTNNMSQCMRFPTMWHFGMCRVRRASTASF